MISATGTQFIAIGALLALKSALGLDAEQLALKSFDWRAKGRFCGYKPVFFGTGALIIAVFVAFYS